MATADEVSRRVNLQGMRFLKVFFFGKNLILEIRHVPTLSDLSLIEICTLEVLSAFDHKYVLWVLKITELSIQNRQNDK